MSNDGDSDGYEKVSSRRKKPSRSAALSPTEAVTKPISVFDLDTDLPSSLNVSNVAAENFFDGHLKIEKIGIGHKKLEVFFLPLVENSGQNELKLGVWKWELPDASMQFSDHFDAVSNRKLGKLLVDLTHTPQTFIDQSANDELYFGLIEMKLAGRVEGKLIQQYSALRLQWSDSSSPPTPSFHKKRLLIGGDTLNAAKLESIAIKNPDVLYWVPNRPGTEKPNEPIHFDQTLVKFSILNQKRDDVRLTFKYCEPVKIGIHYIYSGSDDPNNDPKEDGVLIPQGWGEIGITFRLYRTQQGLEAAKNEKGVLVVMQLARGAHEEFLNFRMKWQENKWNPEITCEKPIEFEKAKAEMVNEEEDKSSKISYNFFP
ncbi:unnamed protein product, partial [Mesorhabditis belari]|uniref:Uncharacterized protein n=1 Tax=Mesorhabditis belari TaxID=2138241 RepID=A0AAF3FL71_9BILA